MDRTSIYFFMGVMLLSGTANTLLMKFQVMQTVPMSQGAKASGFAHPFLQTLLMMIGEVLCLAVFLSQRRPKQAPGTEAPKWVFTIPCACDWTATTLVNAAYVFIPASVVQMTRGAIVIFTCLFSVVFLGRRQHAYHLAGVFLVFVGISLVSLSAFVNPAHGGAVSASDSRTFYKIVGISLCIGAQVFQASMLVVEEKFLSKYDIPPMQMVGMEGFFGIFVGMFLLSVLNPLGLENTPGALYQMSHSAPLAAACIASIFSIAFFNWSGVTVTQRSSAVARSTIDVSRTILIWAVELALLWNVFNWLQLGGFVVLALGTLLYNRIITVSFLDPADEGESKELVPKKKEQEV